MRSADHDDSSLIERAAPEPLFTASDVARRLAVSPSRRLAVSPATVYSLAGIGDLARLVRIGRPVLRITLAGDPEPSATMRVIAGGRVESHGKAAERLVTERVRAALPAEAFHLYPNAEWLGSMRDGGPPRDGEADLVIVHADHGILVLEVKSGIPSRDHAGRWWIGGLALDRDPFTQAKESKHQLVRKLADMADWPPRTEPRAGHAIALPDVDLASLPRGHVLLGADAPRELVLDAEALETPESIRRWVEGAHAYWLGDGSKGVPLGALGVRLLDELLAPTWALHRLVRGRIEDDRAELLAASREQALIVSRTKTLRRLEVVGPAGSGKSMLAAEKARRLAREGYRTLLVCFNQRLATSLIRELEEAPAPAGLDVTTFHRLCERLGSDAGVLPPRPEPIPGAWWDETLPGALEAAIDALPDRRYHAVVVDEGQDFETRWFELLQRLLVDPGDVFWVFHDPGQALIRADVVGGLGLERHELFENRRNPESIAALAGRFYRGGEEEALSEPGALLARRPVVVQPKLRSPRYGDDEDPISTKESLAGP
jgi:AAA domain/Nuclease-related domain